MYETLLRLYKENKIDDTALTSAVNKRWITASDKSKIIASK